MLDLSPDKETKYRSSSGKKLCEDTFAIAELHHRFANVLQSLRTTLQRDARSTVDPCAAAAFKRADCQIHAFGLLNARLRESSLEGLSSTICAKSYLCDVCTDLAHAALDPSRIAFSYKAEEALPLPEPMCRSLALLVIELVLNAAKHAFVGRTSGSILVALEVVSPNSLQLIVGDDGIGLPPVETFKRNEGLRYVETLAKSLGAVAEITTGPAGTRYTFKLDC